MTLYGVGFLQVFYCYFYYYDDNFYSYYYDHYFYYFYFYYSYFYFYFYVYFYVYFYYYDHYHYHYYYYYAVQTCGVPNGGRPRHTARSRFESDPWRIYLIVQLVARVLPPATHPL